MVMVSSPLLFSLLQFFLPKLKLMWILKTPSSCVPLLHTSGNYLTGLASNTGTPFQFQASGSTNVGTSNTNPQAVMFSAGSQGQSLGNTAMGGSQQQQQQQQSGMFQFGQTATTGVASASDTQGYRFAVGSGPNLNFAQNTNSVFPASGNSATTTELSRRVIRKATRRKKTWHTWHHYTTCKKLLHLLKMYDICLALCFCG